MNRRSLTFLLVVGFALMARLASAAPSKPISPPCAPLAGTFVFTLFQFTSPTTAIGQGFVSIDGQAVGTFSADYFNIEQKGQGVTQLNGMHTVTLLADPSTTFNTFDEIRLQSDNRNPAVASANSRLYIIGGTGAYAGATGLLHTHGKLNVVTLEGGIDFKGQICVP